MVCRIPWGFLVVGCYDHDLEMNVDPFVERNLEDDMNIPKHAWLENSFGEAGMEYTREDWASVKVDEGECDHKNVYRGHYSRPHTPL